MAEIGFYDSDPERFSTTALPPLLGRTLKLAERAVILCPAPRNRHYPRRQPLAKH